MSNESSIRPMTRDEIDLAVEWAAAEGWNPGWHDATAFHAADPEGFLISLEHGEPTAVISAVRYGESFGFIGFYIVRPDRRGRGHGLRIWNEAMRRLAGRVVGLDGVLAQQDNYRKSGFRLAYRNVRYEGRGGGDPRDLPPGIVALDIPGFEAVEAYDRPFFPAPRGAFLRAWLRQPGSRALGRLHEGRLAGYGVIRPCRHGHKIGPLFADRPEDAEALFTALTAGLGPEEAVFLDVPAPHREAVALAARHGMRVVFETARMYTGPAPELPMSRLYGVTSFELG